MTTSSQDKKIAFEQNNLIFLECNKCRRSYIDGVVYKVTFYEDENEDPDVEPDGPKDWKCPEHPSAVVNALHYEVDDLPQEQQQELLRCSKCRNGVFTLYKYDKREIAQCCECGATTIVTHLREEGDGR